MQTQAFPEVLRRAIGGDSVATGLLLLSVDKRLRTALERRLPRRLRALVTPEDVAQEAYADVYLHIRRFRPRGGPESFYAWLWTIARHRMLDALKAERALKRGRALRTIRGDLSWCCDPAAPIVETVTDTGPSPGSIARRREALAAMRQALARLEPPDYREVLRLRFLEAMPVADVARLIGRSPGGVHMLTCRALLKLQGLMGTASQYLSSTA